MFESLAKLKLVYAVFQKGKMVADPVKWKKRQVTSGMIAALLASVIGLAKAFGYDIPLTDDQLLQIGGAIIAVGGLFNAGVTVASTDKFGLQHRADDAADASPQVELFPESGAAPEPAPATAAGPAAKPPGRNQPPAATLDVPQFRQPDVAAGRAARVTPDAPKPDAIGFGD
jgi:hypothetical protein